MNSFFKQNVKHPPASPTRLLFLTPSIRLLGARQSLLELVQNLETERWKPLVVCSGRGGLQARLADCGIPHMIIPHRAWRKGRHFATRYLQAWRIARVIGEHHPSLLHANEFHILPQALTAARIHARRGARPPLPVTAHIRLGITPRQIRTYRLREAKRIVVVSRAVASLFQGHPEIQRKVRVVYNGVNLSRFDPPDEAERLQARKAMGVEPEDFVVGLVGLISPRKCQHVAVEAVARIRETCPSLRLVFAGEPFESTVAYGDRLKESIAARGLGDTVHFLGFRENIPEVYSSMDFNLLISDEEGFGRTIIEAGAMGVPSIGTRIGGIPELIEDGETGHLIDQNDADGLARLIREGYENREHLREMGKAARRHVVERFSIQAHVRAMETVWQEALED